MGKSIIEKFHTKEIEIGGEIFQVEYREYSDNFEYEDSIENKMLEKLNEITSLYYRFKIKIESIYWNIYHGFERMFKGYDSIDTFEIFSKFIERYSKILREYRKNHLGYVGTMSAEEWDDIIDDMLYHLYFMDENNVEKELCKDVPESWIPSYQVVQEIMSGHKDRFFELFSKYFYFLWD